LRDGESDIAIVGGTNLLLNPEMFMFLSNQDFLSPDGKSKAFDESANGYGRGEGFGCVVLKRVDDALQAVDPIRAVIRGTGSNHDGHTKGLTLPSADAQAALINEVYRNAGLDFKDTGYVEAHASYTCPNHHTILTFLRELVRKQAILQKCKHWRRRLVQSTHRPTSS
jgi:zearalenone synthase (highly reducing iterative type I polyketide synthase)